MTGFIVLFDFLKRYKSVDQGTQPDQRADRCADKTGKWNGDDDAATKHQQRKNAENQADDGMFVGCF